MCTLWSCKSIPTQKAKLLWNGQLLYEVSRKCHFAFSFDSTLCEWGCDTGIIFWCPHNSPSRDTWPFEPKINWLRQTVKDYAVLCQVLSHCNQRFLLYCANILEHTHTHVVTEWWQYLHSTAVLCRHWVLVIVKYTNWRWQCTVHMSCHIQWSQLTDACCRWLLVQVSSKSFIMALSVKMPQTTRKSNLMYLSELTA